MTADFIESLRTAHRPVVMEVKRTDADGHDLLGGRSVADLVAAYDEAGAPCISVVTGHWFGGDLGLLGQVAALTGRPLLRKDFIVSRRQLVASRAAGAGAVLLTARLLAAEVLAALVEQSLELGLTPFVEITTAAEAERIPYGEHCVVAVSNKDIGVRERDAGTAERSLALLPQVRRTGTGCPVSASGIGGPQEAARLLAAGYRGVLIGTALLRTGSIRTWCDDFDAARRAPGPA